MGSSDLLFIHKDQKSKSLSSSTGSERKQIYRHVHLGRPKRPTKQLEKTGLLEGIDQTESLVVKNDETPEILEEDPQKRLAGGVRRLQRRREPRSHRPSATKNQSGEKHSNRTSDAVVVHHHERQRSLKPSAIRGNSMEPFDVFTVPLDPETLALLDYFAAISHPRAWYPKSRMSKGEIRSQDPPSTVIQRCLEDEMSTLTMLAATATQMRHLEGRSPYRDDATLIQKALMATQEYVASCSIADQRLITAVLFLAYAECYRWDAQAARIHMQAVKRLSDQLGGLAALQPHLQWWVLAADELITVQLLPGKPLFAWKDVDPGPFNTQVETNPASGCESGLVVSGKAWAQQLPGWLLLVLSDLLDCLPQLEFLFSGQGGSDNDPDVQELRPWIHTRMWAIRARLLALDTQEPRAEAVRLALLVWVYMIAPARRRMSMQIIARRLKTLVNSACKATWGSSGDLYRWILLVGALGSAGNDNNRGWFIRQIIDACQTCHSESRESGLTELDLKSMLNRVLYLEAVQGPMLAELAVELGSETRVADHAATGSRDTTGDK